MNTNVVAQNIVRHLLFDAGSDLEVDTRLKLSKEALCRPAFTQEQVLEAGAVTALTQNILIAEDFSNGTRYRYSLLRQHERIKPNRQVRLVRQAAANAQRKTRLSIAHSRRKRNVVDLGIGAPVRATGSADFEFARQVHEQWIALKFLRNREC